jgi:hypothetical protein
MHNICLTSPIKAPQSGHCLRLSNRPTLQSPHCDITDYSACPIMVGKKSVSFNVEPGGRTGALARRRRRASWNWVRPVDAELEILEETLGGAPQPPQSRGYVSARRLKDLFLYLRREFTLFGPDPPKPVHETYTSVLIIFVRFVLTSFLLISSFRTFICPIITPIIGRNGIPWVALGDCSPCHFLNPFCLTGRYAGGLCVSNLDCTVHYCILGWNGIKQWVLTCTAAGGREIRSLARHFH